MQNLAASLSDHPMALLRGIAEVRGVALRTNARADAAAHLAAVLAEAGATERALDTCSLQARDAWRALCAGGGRATMPAFTRAHGAIRPLGPGKLERETPWRQPASPAEELWFRGLIFRGFADVGDGPLEYIYVPAELLSLCGEPEQAAAAAPAPPPEQVFDHGNALAMDACQVLAALRAAPARVDAAGQVRPADRPYLSAGLLAKDPVRLDLLLVLMRQAGWLAIERGRLVTDPNAAAEWLRLGWWPQITALFEAWRDSTDAAPGGVGWNDLRRLPGLRAEGGWRNDPLLARRALRDALRGTPAGEWRSLEGLVAAIKAHRPDFQRPDGNYTGWYLKDSATGHFLSGFESWDEVEGRLLRFMIRGSLHWLGAVALGPAPGAAADAFSLTPAGSAWLAGGDPPDPPRSARLIIRDETTLIAPPALPLMDRFRLLRFTEPAGDAEPGRATQHRITRESLARARAEGLKAQALLKFLEQAGDGRVPDRLAAGLERWDQHSGAVRVSRGAVLRVDDAATLAMMRSDPVVRPLLGDLLSAQAVLVSEGNLPRVLAALQELGYSVKVE